jgi:hypothetical protein
MNVDVTGKGVKPDGHAEKLDDGETLILPFVCVVSRRILLPIPAARRKDGRRSRQD